MIELEKTYLAKELPKDLENCRFKEIIDIYIPKNSEHPSLRLRKNGNKFEMTRKEPVTDGDASQQKEHTIPLTEKEFEALNKIEGKRVRKMRHFYDCDGATAEFDVFQDDLEGLVVVDFEFENTKEKDDFEMPDFCLSDVTQENFIAGGMICGKCYSDIESDLEKFDYKKLFLK
ncbi:MAG: CYTH domain-containing protein [Candidatus Moranbacteria bacterium]|nr:CYTH domain-containing protein [Candidatus Moranbacteria bacterium]